MFLRINFFYNNIPQYYENERILKKILYFDIFSILLLFIKPLASKNFWFPDYCGLQGLIFCVIKCWSTVGPIAIIMYTDWSTWWSKVTQIVTNVIFFPRHFQNTSHNVSFNISIYRMLKWQPSTSLLCILNSLQIDSCCLLSLCYKKFLILNRLGQVVMILTCIWQVPGLNFGLDSACRDWGWWWLSSVLPGILSDSACS